MRLPLLNSFFRAWVACACKAGLIVLVSCPITPKLCGVVNGFGIGAVGGGAVSAGAWEPLTVCVGKIVPLRNCIPEGGGGPAVAGREATGCEAGSNNVICPVAGLAYGIKCARGSGAGFKFPVGTIHIFPVVVSGAGLYSHAGFSRPESTFPTPWLICALVSPIAVGAGAGAVGAAVGVVTGYLFAT